MINPAAETNSTHATGGYADEEVNTTRSDAYRRFRELIVPELGAVGLLGEGPGLLPYEFPDVLAEVFEEHGKRVFLPVASDGFSENVLFATFIRVTGRTLFESLTNKGIPQFAENYHTRWLQLVRDTLGYQRLQAYEDMDRAAVGNGLYVEGDHFPVYFDMTAASMAIGGSNVPKSGDGTLMVSLSEQAVGIDDLARRPSYKIHMSAGLGVIFDGRQKLHGSQGIKVDDAPRRTIALSYDDPLDQTIRPKQFNTARNSAV